MTPAERALASVELDIYQDALLHPQNFFLDPEDIGSWFMPLLLDHLNSSIMSIQGTGTSPRRRFIEHHLNSIEAEHGEAAVISLLRRARHLQRLKTRCIV